jgi:hypothetical protein
LQGKRPDVWTEKKKKKKKKKTVNKAIRKNAKSLEDC